MKFFSIKMQGSDAVVVEANSEAVALNDYAVIWYGAPSWDELLADGFPDDLCTIEQVNHGPATVYPKTTIVAWGGVGESEGEGDGDGDGENKPD